MTNDLLPPLEVIYKLPTFVFEGATYRVSPNMKNGYNWNAAKSACNLLVYDNQTEWILPSLSMCKEMYNYGVTGFTNRWYWSSSSANNTDTKAWYYDFSYGTSKYDTTAESYSVRCVRREN